jgi:hypothetical protein
MVYTNELLVFTRLGNDELADIVPLNEILTVHGLEGELEVDPFKNSFIGEQNEDADAAEFALEIKTILDGYNSGRAYRIRVKSEKDRQSITERLSYLSARERERAVSKSRFKQMQDRVAAVINSNFVQRFLAFLIIAVCLCLFNGVATTDCHLK